MTPTIDVSVVVAVRNGAATVGEALESLLSLRYPADAMEIIVVDNGSTDATPELVLASGDRVQLLHEIRRGAGAARNCGIRAARGRVVAFTDADAVADPDWLNMILPPLSDPSVGVVGGAIQAHDRLHRIERFGERVHNQKEAIEDKTHPYAMSGNWASRRDVLLEVGLFDETLLRGQDVDLAWRIRQAGYRLVYAPDAIVRHRNERTIMGLLHEGFVHGLHGSRLLEKFRQPRAKKRKRLWRALRRLARGDDMIDNALALLFDAGKITGQLVAQVRSLASRSGSRNGTPA